MRNLLDAASVAQCLDEEPSDGETACPHWRNLLRRLFLRKFFHAAGSLLARLIEPSKFMTVLSSLIRPHEMAPRKYRIMPAAQQAPSVVIMPTLKRKFERAQGVRGH